jgi:hypothetical protein
MKFGNESFESLMVQMYDELVGRGDMALNIAYNIDYTTDRDSSWRLTVLNVLLV